jgi:glycosyltransferase involved in cell wall biosynthesis
VISERNDPTRQELQEPWRSLRPRVYPLADLITANSHGALRELTNYCPAEKLAYVANPIAISEEPSSAGRTSSILFLARLIPQKAPDILIEAFAQFARQHPEWSLEIAGDGAMGPELRTRVDALGLDRQVKFHGHVKDPTDLLARSRVFALPSRFEGTPNSLLEAMASGLACIVSDASPGPLTLVEHEKSGLVVRTDDPAALAEAFARLADDSDFQLEMATAARERTREFLIDSVAGQWETLLFPHDRCDLGVPSRA